MFRIVVVVAAKLENWVRKKEKNIPMDDQKRNKPKSNKRARIENRTTFFKQCRSKKIQGLCNMSDSVNEKKNKKKEFKRRVYSKK